MFTMENTVGYTQDELDALNQEFLERWDSGYYEGVARDQDEAENLFADEVSRR